PGATIWWRRTAASAPSWKPTRRPRSIPASSSARSATSSRHRRRAASAPSWRRSAAASRDASTGARRAASPAAGCPGRARPDGDPPGGEAMELPVISRLKKELADLKYELTVKLPKELEAARGHGDLSENAEYEAAKARQDYVRSRIAQLEGRVRE